MRRWVRSRRRSRRKGRRSRRRRTETMGKEEVEVEEKEEECFLVKASQVLASCSHNSAGQATIVTQSHTKPVGGAL